MKKLFTQEEIQLLEKNPYTYKVSESVLKFNDDFRDDFWRLYLSEMPIKEIFSTLGYDYDLLGQKRADGFVYNLRKERLTSEQRIESKSRASRVKRPPADIKYSSLPSSDAIKAMEAEITYLRQEVEFLKKLYALLPSTLEEQ